MILYIPIYFNSQTGSSTKNFKYKLHSGLDFHHSLVCEEKYNYLSLPA